MLARFMAALTEPANSAEQGSHYFLLVMQPPDRKVRLDGVTFYSTPGPVYWSSTYTPEKGMTRFDVQEFLVKDLLQKRPDLRGGAVIAFQLEHNQLYLG
jgi:hypothetical protein